MIEEEKQEKQCKAIASILEIEDISILKNVKEVLSKRIDKLITDDYGGVFYSCEDNQ